MRSNYIKLGLVLLLISYKVSAQVDYPFRQDNLIPWSIVAYDEKQRSPIERVDMLKDLGFSQYAFGGRPRHIATMEHELTYAASQGIKISAVWLYIHPDKDQPGALKPESRAVLEVLRNMELQTQIWVGFHHEYTQGLSEEEGFAKAREMVDYLALEADALGCKLALYNHGGWFGNPINQLRILNSLKEHDIGIIYNFHHAHEHLEEFEEIFFSIQKYVWCINLNGMRKEGPKILPVGQGDLEKEMIQFILEQGYQGPFGLIGHVKGGDAAEILSVNFAGLRRIFPSQD